MWWERSRQRPHLTQQARFFNNLQIALHSVRDDSYMASVSLQTAKLGMRLLGNRANSKQIGNAQVPLGGNKESTRPLPPMIREDAYIGECCNLLNVMNLFFFILLFGDAEEVQRFCLLVC